MNNVVIVIKNKKTPNIQELLGEGKAIRNLRDATKNLQTPIRKENNGGMGICGFASGAKSVQLMK